MKTATVQDLRNRFQQVAAWIEAGKQVEITRYGKPFAYLVPVPPKRARAKPDIMAQLKEVWGERVFSSREIAEMRDTEDSSSS